MRNYSPLIMIPVFQLYAHQQNQKMDHFCFPFSQFKTKIEKNPKFLILFFSFQNENPLAFK